MPPTTSNRVERLEDLVRRYASLTDDERTLFLARECGSDENLQAEIIQRLSQHDQTQSWPPPGSVAGPPSGADMAPLTISVDGGSTHGESPAWRSIDNSETALELPSRPEGAVTSLKRIGTYEILGEIARGGMGVVFKARDVKLQRLAAIKIPRAAQLEEEGEARFLREARSAARLHHPNICPIYEVGQTAEQPFIALGFVDGPTLKEWAKRERPNARRAAELIAKVALAVDHAHQHDVIHRDIKPSNIMLEAATGEPVLMDFGLAKQLSETESDFTRSGQIMGTPVYMSPEQAAGRLDRIGPTTDVYALGAVLYELLTGRPPFSGALGEVLRQVQCEPPPPPRSIASTVHRDLETICLKAMAKEPALRYATAAALADDLQRFAAGEAILARREGPVARVRRAARRHWRAAVLTAALAGVALAVVGYATRGAQHARQTTTIARQIDARLESADASNEHRQALEELLTNLAKLDEAEAARLRQRMHVSFAQKILSKSRIEPDDFAAFELERKWLEQHDSQAAAALQEQFQRRLRTWQSTFRLSAPYDAWDTILPREAVDARGDRLVRLPAAQSPAPGTQLSPHRVLTSVVSRGHVRLEAVFGKGWQDCDDIGLLLHATERRGYGFRLRPTAGARPSSDHDEAPVAAQQFVSFAKAIEQRGSVRVSILRDGHLLRDDSLRAAELQGLERGELSLAALVEGSRVEFTVAGKRTVVFDDVFGHGGEPQSKFGLVWPPAVELVSLAAFSQAMPVTPSPLDEGDELFANRQWDAALEKYRTQASLTHDPQQIAQAQFKIALCLLQLQRTADAKAIFESLSSNENDRLQVLAACQLWLLAVQQRQYDEAQIIFENLQSRYSFEQLAFLVPEEDRNRIVHAIYAATTGLNLYRFDDNDLQFLRQAHAVARLLDQHATIETRNARVWQLVRASHMCGDLDAAIQVGTEYLSQFDGPTDHFPTNMAEEISWMLRQQNRSAEASELLNRFLHHPANAQGRARALLVERARVRVSQQRWPEAAADVDEFLNDPTARASYNSFAHACLLRGFLHEREGEIEAAQTVWRRGNYHVWVMGLTSQEGRRLTGMGATGAFLLAVFTDELTAARFQEIYASPLSADWSGVTGELFQQYIPLIAESAKAIASDEFGRGTCRKLAYRECSFAEFARDPIALIFLELSRRGAAPENWNDDERELIWQLFHAALEDYRTKRLGNSQAVQFMLTWKGANNVFGWQTLQAKLSPDVRCRAAYMFGHRYEKLGKPQDAIKLFQTAVADAPQDSRIAALAKSQLERLQGK